MTGEELAQARRLATDYRLKPEADYLRALLGVALECLDRLAPQPAETVPQPAQRKRAPRKRKTTTKAG